MSTSEEFKVLIVGAGVAGLEAALALRDLAGDRVNLTLLAPAGEFTYRPMVVREPFGYSRAKHFPLDEIARDLHAELVPDAFKWLEADARTVHTEGGATLRYDALLLAQGARMRPRFRHAVTVDDRVIDEQLHGLIQDIEGGYVRRLAFVVPEPMPWPLPVYELALMTAGRAFDTGERLAVTIITPEDAPLAIFGSSVSDAVQEMLTDNGVEVLTSAHAEVPSPGNISVHPGERALKADRIVSLPQLFGPATPGLPKDAEDGFIPVDEHCRVRGAERVFAAGDATTFSVKFGGIAAQQADTAAQAIAALAGAEIEPRPFHPVVRGVLFGADGAWRISAHITGGHGSTSQIAKLQPGEPVVKIDAKYLGPYLEARESAARAA